MYETLVDEVYRYAYYRCRARADVAEDITQEVFQRALESIHGYQGDIAGLLAWLKGIALRILARRGRAARRRSDRVVLSQAVGPGRGHGMSETVDSARAVDDRIISEEQELMIGVALSSLRPQWELALRLKYCEGLTVQAISERLALTAKATESVLTRARAAFRKAYTRIADTEEPPDADRMQSWAANE
ncbi:MAG: sigma-70 family RNA polymerase sigma factor [Sedimentisphaerales bacterium]|nr:sigma-70 family RNA polymerase sigma factor [Sedimentisphaerales bacterium]